MTENRPTLLDHEPTTDRFTDEVIEGLQMNPPQLPCKLLYDQEGSKLYDAITRCDDYYPTRTEASILEQNIAEIRERIGPKAVLIEYGSGSSEKTRTLLSNLDWRAYVPIDISREHLVQASQAIAREYPNIPVFPVCADYGEPFELPEQALESDHRVVFFPGSTIGNFHPSEAVKFLNRMKRVCGPHGRLLIGVDVPKERHILERAYDDSEGLTARFNLNILDHLNREVGSDFDTSQFRHRAVYEPSRHRVEMHLVSQSEQDVSIGPITISLDKGDFIWTESSYKYPPELFRQIAADAGFEVDTTWTDEEGLFSVQLLKPFEV